MSFKAQYIVVASMIFTIISTVSYEVRAQENTIFEVQNRFDRGDLSAQQAMDEQWELITRTDGHEHTIKCITPVMMFAEQHKSELNKSYSPPLIAGTSATRTYISPGGKFLITYEDSGTNSVPLEDSNSNNVPDYVEEVAIAADFSYTTHVNDIGFIDPITPGGLYNIEIINQVNGIYGFTSVRNDPSANTYISIDNNYIGYNPNSVEDQQLGSMQVTVAHEFKHAVQYAANQWRNPSGNVFWAEMDATLMEEIVYDEVNDYYNYINNGFSSDQPNRFSVFAAPESPTPGSYNHITWMLYFAERFGMDVFRNVWEQIEQNNTLGIVEALEKALIDLEGVGFEEAFAENHLWHYFSNYRAEGFDNYGFDEKENYPIARVEQTLTSVSDNPITLNTISPLAARYIEINPSVGDEGLIDLGLDFNQNQVGLGVLLYLKNGQIVDRLLSGSNKVQLYFSSEYSWQDIDRMGLVITNHDEVISTGDITLLVGKNGNRFRILDPEVIGIPEDFAIKQNYPNPFNPSTVIEFELPQATFVKLDIYSITGQFIQTLANEDLGIGVHQRRFDASGLASGTYLYRLQLGAEVYIRKMTYIR